MEPTPGFLKKLIASAAVAPKEGEEWCVLSMDWWRQALEADAEGLEDPELPDVDNLTLCASSEDEKAGMNDAILRKGIKEDHDYKLVPLKTWEDIHDRYGGGPRFTRKVIEIRGAPLVELYLYTLRVTYLKRNKVVDLDDFKSSIPQIQAIKFEVSRKATIKDLRAEFAQAFDISPEEASELAIYNYLDDVQGEAIYDYVDESDSSLTTTKQTPELATVHSVRLVDNNALLLDLKPQEEAPAQKLVEETQGLSVNVAAGVDVKADGVSKSELTFDEFLAKPSLHPRGVCGLRNLGNTCFMNSALQCLSATAPLIEYYVTGRYKKEINKTNPLGKGGDIALEFGKLMSAMWAGKDLNLVPRDFKWMIGTVSSRFDDFSQQDAQELLAFLLDGLHEDCNRVLSKPQTPAIDISNDTDQSLIEAADQSWKHYLSRNDSAIVDLFQAQLKSKLECPDCGHVSITFDPFMYLSLPIPTDSIRTREILFFFSRGSMRCALQLPRTATMLHVKQQLSAMTGISASRIVLADIHNAQVIKRFHNTDRFELVAKNDTFVAYELQYDITKPLVGKVVVPVLQRCLQTNYNEALARHTFNHTCIGMPFFIAVDKHITHGDLVETIKKQLQPVIDLNQPALDKKPTPFTISKVKANGTTITPLTEWQGGSTTRVGSNKQGEVSPTEGYNLHCVIHPGDTLSIDWDVSIAPRPTAQTLPRVTPMKDHPKFEETMASGALAASKPTTVEDCFKAFVKSEKLDGGNQWRCPKCKLEKEATKSIAIWTLPEILVVHLKRFTDVGYTRQKIANTVYYPVHQLDLMPFIAQRPEDVVDARLPKPHETKYDLFAVSNHYGAIGGGHYTAISQHFTTGDWYEYDDHQVHKLEEKDVVSNAAYVLFYRRAPASALPSKL